MSKDVECMFSPHKDYPFFYYSPHGDGHVFFKTKEKRDEAANKEVGLGLNQDGWDEETENIFIGKITGKAAKVDEIKRPEKIDDEGFDEAGNYWDADWDSMCNYAIKPLDFKDS